MKPALLLALAWPCSTWAQVQPTTVDELAGQEIAIVSERLRPSTVAIRSEGQGSTRLGNGLIVAEKGDALLIVTALHVVEPSFTTLDVSVGVFVDDDRRLNIHGQVQGEESDAHPGDDLVFIEVGRQPSQARLQVGSEDAHVGAFASHLGTSGSWAISRTPGRIASVSIGGMLEFSSAGVKESFSGGPLIGAGGVVGIITDTTDERSSTARSISSIKARFDQSFAAQGWTWLLQPSPQRKPNGFVLINRTDQNAGAIILVGSDKRETIVRASVTASVPVGTYRAKSVSIGAAPMRCQPAQITVQENKLFSTSMACEFEIAGIWKGAMGTGLSISPGPAGEYHIVYANDPLFSGEGTGRFDGREFTMFIQQPDGQSWSARLAISEFGLRGTISNAPGMTAPFPLMFTRREAP